jgi:putative membrane protein
MKEKFNGQALFLIVMGLFVYSRIYTGTIFFYINERFLTLTLLGAIGLIVVGLICFIRQDDSAAACCHEEPGHGGYGHRGYGHGGYGHGGYGHGGYGHGGYGHRGYGHGGCDHEEHHHHHSLSWWGLLILSLPVALGMLVIPQPLTTAAMSNRDLNLGTWSDGPAAAHAVTVAPPAERNILDWLRLFQAEPEASAFDGQEARLTGFVYREERFEAGSFMVGRFIIIHCVADASPAGLIVRWPEAASLRDDQWVEVYGRLKAGEFDGRAMPILWAESVNAIQPPAQPYLYR